MSYTSDLRLLLRGENLSSPNKAKWGATYELTGQDLDIAPETVYATFIGKASNAQVRLGKQISEGPEYKVALAFGGDGNRTSKSYARHAVAALRRVSTLEAVVLFFEDGQVGSGDWTPERVYARTGSGLVAAIKRWNDAVHVEEFADVNDSPTPPGPISHLVPEELTVPADQLSDVFQLLRKSRNVLLKGVPGVGKTYLCRSIILEWEAAMQRPLAEYRLLMLHPSSSYEDMIEGIRPGRPQEPTSSLKPQAMGLSVFEPRLGRIAEFCERAKEEPEADFLLILDELNRTNLAAAFGEFLLLVEGSKRALYNPEVRAWEPKLDGAVSLTYSGREFFLPENLYVIGTMNTSDRSISPMDRAMFRRFEEVRLEPIDVEDARLWLLEPSSEVSEVFNDCAGVWAILNEQLLSAHVGPDGLIGHAGLKSLASALNSGVDPIVAGRQFLEFGLLPQLIFVVGAFGLEDLLIAGDFADQANTVADLLGRSLERYGLAIELVGTGAGRRLSVSDI